MEEYVTDGITQDIIGNLSKNFFAEKVIGWVSVKVLENNKNNKRNCQ